MNYTAPVLYGLRQRCGGCGEGRLFSAYLKLNEACPHCGRDMRAADTADGTAFFVGFGVLILTAPFLFLIPMSPLPPLMKAGAIVFVALVITGLSMWLLPVAKGILLNLQLQLEAAAGPSMDLKKNGTLNKVGPGFFFSAGVETQSGHRATWTRGTVHGRRAPAEAAAHEGGRHRQGCAHRLPGNLEGQVTMISLTKWASAAVVAGAMLVSPQAMAIPLGTDASVKVGGSY